jgi:hypothetical protein
MTPHDSLFSLSSYRQLLKPNKHQNTLHTKNTGCEAVSLLRISLFTFTSVYRTYSHAVRYVFCVPHFAAVGARNTSTLDAVGHRRVEGWLIRRSEVRQLLNETAYHCGLT